jgi:hypothetical protein
MGKRLLAVLAVIAFLSGAVLLGLSGAADVPDEFVIQDSLWAKHTKSGVKFSHKKHAEEYGVACNECHHVFEGGKNVFKEGDPVQKCHDCHNEPTIKGEKKLSKDKQKLNLKIAFHNNCQSCHKKLKKEDKAKYGKIPTTCIQCHPKKK